MPTGSAMDHAVLVGGGGPTGLMLAGELALAGVDVAVVERRTTQAVDGSRAGGLYPRTLEVLDQRGIVERFVEAGFVVPALAYGGTMLDLGDFPTRHNHVLALWQAAFGPILASWVEGLGVPILRGREIVGLTPDADGVDVVASAVGSRRPTGLRAAWVVGCDGGRSVVRREAGIAFTGLDPTTSWMIAEVRMDGEPELGFRHDATGSHVLARRQADDPVRVLLTEPEVQTGEPDLDELRAGIVRVYGTDFGLRDATWISRFTDRTRQAETYRRGRVLLAGDAAHVHPPHGGQGLNTGVQDAVNLAWKLAQVVSGVSPQTLLDTYHAERHPVAARVLHTTMALVALARPGERHQALRDTMADLLALDGPRRRIAGMQSGLDVHYDLGGGHPLIGRRVPDLDLDTADGTVRLYTLLHPARPLLVDLDPTGSAASDRVDLTPWADRVRRVEARHNGPWELPVIGPVAPPPAVLVRPDGHVAWTGTLSDPSLIGALTTWFGAP